MGLWAIVSKFERYVASAYHQSAILRRGHCHHSKGPGPSVQTDERSARSRDSTIAALQGDFDECNEHTRALQPARQVPMTEQGSQNCEVGLGTIESFERRMSQPKSNKRIVMPELLLLQRHANIRNTLLKPIFPLFRTAPVSSFPKISNPS